MPGAATDLVAARARLLRRTPSDSRLDAHALRDALADLAELWLTTHGHAAGILPDSGLALVAVGGLGRRELLPYSDFDLILLHDDGVPIESVAEAADSLWYPLWDAHIKLDHSVRTVPQALQVASSDLSAAHGMLEARHIVGDEALSTLLVTGVRRQWRSDIRGRFPELVEQAEERWRRSGEIAHRAEPDLKNGRGGMRDVQLLRSLSIAQLTDGIPVLDGAAGPGGVAHAHARLLDARTELHRTAGRARDQLRAQDADEIGAALRVGDRFDLARTVSDSARTVAFAVDVGIRTAANALPRKGIARIRKTPARRPLAEGVVAQAGEVVLARDANPARDPGLTVRVAAAAAAHDLPISVGTLARLADAAPEPREPWPEEAVDDFLRLLGAGRRSVRVIESLDRTGLWGRLLPEWGAVRDLPPRDAIHTWTVDRHLVETASWAASFASRVTRPDLLVLGALLHDLGKGRGGDHSIVGAEIAAQVCRRLGLPDADAAVVESMVRYHLLLPEVATRRDLDDPATVEKVVTALGGNPVLLELLHVLAEADSLATGPGVWGDWKSSLIGDLVRRARLAMAGEPLPEPTPPDDETVAIAADGGTHIRIAPAPERGPHTYAVTVVSPDRRGLLARMAGVLALAGLRVQDASVTAVGDAAVNRFVVVPNFGTPADEAIVRQQLLAALSGATDVKAELDARESAAEPPLAGGAAGPPLRSASPARVRWFEQADRTVVLEVRAGDRLGLLARVASILETAGADVLWARAITHGASVVDVFCVAPPSDPGFRDTVEAAVLEVVPAAEPPPTPDELASR
ncbi:[protein-PII] uridylyltransferase [Tsukamurella sp. 8F]|uniref:[protein-PII] uridylyltransferase n=1 Tax=unclassified Tsukamurella TaxID=2633480 RepID=UPI0023BA1CAC|nr:MULTISPECIES: [protein-PII] uridylyltransferase [unclassified Tsukamurella]MDF0531238.1 [protein-PII] uridylyltransferase [Tsukamurella sp. 8J]MDF0588507.1 [protein-PII] uridylyltransferase [Tsukamurella sp. 8F]